MKTITTITLAALALSAAPNAYAQEDKSKKKTSSKVQVSVEFAGGNLAEFLALMRSKTKNINIIASAEAVQVELPALKVSNAGVLETLESVSRIVGTGHNVIVTRQSFPPSSPIYAVRVQSVTMRNRPGQAPSRPATSMVKSLNNLTSEIVGRDGTRSNGISTETILTAIDAGLKVGNPLSRAKVKYHEDSGLMFVYGTSSQLQLVDSVLRELHRDRMERQSKLHSAAPPKPTKKKNK